MRIEQQIAQAWAKELSDRIVEETISDLGQMNGDAMLSGGDSTLWSVRHEPTKRGNGIIDTGKHGLVVFARSGTRSEPFS